MDSLVGVFTKKINALPIAKNINLIFTADHGMGHISDQRNIILKNIIPEEWVNEVQGSNPAYLLDIKQQFEDTAFKLLSKINHLKVWKSNAVPKRLHYGKNPRTLDFILVADSAWSLNWDQRKYKGAGTHGYDNDNKDMHAIFYAIGPAFKSNYIHPTFNNIDLYSLIAKILNINPAKTDGDINNVVGLLKER
jgi:alkaline phosphatase D